MDAIDRETVFGMAECDMNITRLSKAKYLHRNSIEYRIQRLKDHTGLDARNFYDLFRLVEMAKGEDA